VSKPNQKDVIIDIRHPSELEAMPLEPTGNKVLKIPFYELLSKLTALEPEQTYLLYCSQNVMSRLQAHAMRRQGFKKVAILKLNH
jgi:thiamine biosynthesis protein ThiI